MNHIAYIGYAVFLTLIAVYSSACSGLEVGGRLGVYRVDERQDSSRTYRESIPLKCYFVRCGDEQIGS